MTIADLIKRVEGLTTGDRSLDVEIARAIIPEVLVPKQDQETLEISDFTYWEYTASVDAVIGLIGEKLPVANWQLEFMSGRHLSVLYPDAASGSFSGDGAGSPALSLLLAFLRAWEQRGDG